MSDFGPESRLRTLGLTLPPVPMPPAASYSSMCVDGSAVHLAGHTPQLPDGPLATGVVGRELDLSTAQACARQCFINILARVRDLTGTLDSVEWIVKLTVFVATAPGFSDLHLVSEGASTLANELFGPGHVRTTVGVVSLPRSSPVEIDGTIRLSSAAAAKLSSR